MNLQRILIGGLVAGIICWLGDGVVHGVLLTARWQEIAKTLNLKGDSGGGMVWFILYDLCKGFASALLYALVRPRLGAGPRTAVIAGLFVWALVLPVPL